jgi:hypothetical protein
MVVIQTVAGKWTVVLFALAGDVFTLLLVISKDLFEVATAITIVARGQQRGIQYIREVVVGLWEKRSSK